MFDRAADTYDNVGVEWFRPIAAGLVAELDPQPGERVLDIGCGRGAALRPLAEDVGPTGHALGIDLAPAMVARTAADLHALSQVEVRPHQRHPRAVRVRCRYGGIAARRWSRRRADRLSNGGRSVP